MNARQIIKMFSNDDNYKVVVRNNQINGKVVGCTGFITNCENGLIVYINTEKSIYAPLADKSLIRYAQNTRDYTGGVNHFATDKGFYSTVKEMLKARKDFKI